MRIPVIILAFKIHREKPSVRLGFDNGQSLFNTQINQAQARHGRHNRLRFSFAYTTKAKPLATGTLTHLSKKEFEGVKYPLGDFNKHKHQGAFGHHSQSFWRQPDSEIRCNRRCFGNCFRQCSA